MRKVIVATMLLPLAACHLSSGGDDATPGVAASGTGPTRSYPVADFTGVELRGSDTVDVRVGPAFSVRAEGDPAVLDQLRIDKADGTLRIGRRRGVSRGGHDAKVFVTMPRLAAAAVAGSGAMTVDRVAGDDFDASGAGSGSLAVATLAVRQATLSMAGSGTMTLGGRADRLKIDMAGSGKIDARNVKAAGAAVSVAGSGDVAATVAGAADVSMLGSGTVTLGPDARCQVSRLGSGTVTCGR